HVVGHDDLDRIALARADHGERDAGVTGRRLEDRLAGADRALLLGVLDQRAGDAVLDRAGGVVRLELGPDAHPRLGRQALELHQRRVADGLHDVAVTAAARAVLQPGHTSGSVVERGRRLRARPDVPAGVPL